MARKKTLNETVDLGVELIVNSMEAAGPATTLIKAVAADTIVAGAATGNLLISGLALAALIISSAYSCIKAKKLPEIKIEDKLKEQLSDALTKAIDSTLSKHDDENIQLLNKYLQDSIDIQVKIDNIPPNCTFENMFKYVRETLYQKNKIENTYYNLSIFNDILDDFELEFHKQLTEHGELYRLLDILDKQKFQKTMDTLISTSKKCHEEIIRKIAELKDGQVELKDGQAELKDGQVELKDGQAELKDGQAGLKDGQAGLKDGQAGLKNDMKEIRDFQKKNYISVDLISKFVNQKKRGESFVELSPSGIVMCNVFKYMELPANWSLDVNSTNLATFSMLMPQISAKIEFSDSEQIIAEQINHDVLCRQIVTKAKEENVSLLVTPEYSFSYNILEEIINKLEMRPNDSKLWCFSMEAITSSAFDAKLQEWKKIENTIIEYNKEYIDEGIINSLLIYCFMYRQKLYMIIQPKIYPDTNREKLFEHNKMTKGKIIYIFGDANHNQLFGLHGRNSIYTDIKEIASNKFIGDNSIIINPICTRELKQKDCLEHKMFNQNRKLLYIRSNWSEKTLINTQKILRTYSSIQIRNQISNQHVWFKKNTDPTEASLAKSNSNNFLGGFCKDKEIEIWYPYEKRDNRLFILTINRLRTIQEREYLNKANLIAENCYFYNENAFEKDTCSQLDCFYDTINDDSSLKNILKDKKSKYYIPYDIDKYKLDILFDKILCNPPYSSICINSNHEAPYMLLKSNLGVTAIKESLNEFFMKLNRNEFPEHLGCLENNHRIKFTDKHDYLSNFSYYKGKYTNTVYLGITDNIVDAINYVEEIVNIRDIDDENKYRRICLYIKNGKENYYPLPETETIIGDREISEGEIL